MEEERRISTNEENRGHEIQANTNKGAGTLGRSWHASNVSASGLTCLTAYSA